MAIKLNQTLVLKLSIDQKPITSKSGVLSYVANPKQTPYIILDNHRDAPRGFGVKVAKTKKTYVIQRRVGTKVIKTKIGNVSDFASIEFARNKGRELVIIAQNTGQNPNTIAREKDAKEIRLIEAFEQYIHHLCNRAKPAKSNTIQAINGAIKRLNAITEKKIVSLQNSEIISIFDKIASTHRTAAEQSFRWAIAATNYAIKHELENASSQQREPTLKYNPFLTLTTNKKFRTSSQLQESYIKNNIRKPLLSNDDLGKWLNAIYSKRDKNRLGCDFLLLCLLWGVRKNEATPLQWRHLINDSDANESSWVDMEKRVVFFYDTKNRQNHKLPIADAAFYILKTRMPIVNSTNKNAKWVFPARSKHSKTGHYNDMNEISKNINIEAGISHRTLHDLRRTFGSIAANITPSNIVKRLLNHQELSDVTTRYTEVKWESLIKSMQDIELSILSKSPKLYNTLLPPKHPKIKLVN